MTAEHSAGNGGEHADQIEQDGRKTLSRTAGEPIVVMRGDEMISVGISHGVHENELYVRDGTGELNTYGVDEFTFVTSADSDLAQFLDDIVSDKNSPDSI